MVLLALIALLPFGGAVSPTPGVCVCASAAQNDGWCDVHEIGYLAGVTIRSQPLYSALDAHGHTLNLDTFDCAECKEAISADGFCEEHRVGFVEGLVYYSKLTHHLARGEKQDLAAVSCPVCRTNSRSHGWCDSCQVGRVGATAIHDRHAFDEILSELHLLELANTAAERCERCAIAIVTDSICVKCRLRYEDGRSTPIVPEVPAPAADVKDN